jgi:hypothetical protein
MNLRRGLLRLWVVLSLGWIVFVGIEIFPSVDWNDPRVEQWRWHNLRLGLEWAFGPPIAVLIGGVALSWAVAGFRRDD